MSRGRLSKSATQWDRTVNKCISWLKFANHELLSK
jgi:hypothetical protein